MRFAPVLLIALAACASQKLDNPTGEFEDGCPDNSVTTRFEVEPAVVARGAEVDITVLWLTTAKLEQPLATFEVGTQPIVEVEVPLVAETATEYRGSLLNPFGAGAPAGVVGVLAEAAPASGCLVFPTASTAFTLE